MYMIFFTKTQQHANQHFIKVNLKFIPETILYSQSKKDIMNIFRSIEFNKKRLQEELVCYAIHLFQNYNIFYSSNIEYLRALINQIDFREIEMCKGDFAEIDKKIMSNIHQLQNNEIFDYIEKLGGIDEIMKSKNNKIIQLSEVAKFYMIQNNEEIKLDEECLKLLKELSQIPELIKIQQDFFKLLQNSTIQKF